MARMASILIPSGDAPVVLSVNGNTTGTVQTIGKNRIFVINADQDITIAFGSSTAKTAVASANSYRIPQNQQFTVDTGQEFDQFSVFNKSASTTASVYYQTLSVV